MQCGDAPGFLIPEGVSLFQLYLCYLFTLYQTIKNSGCFKLKAFADDKTDVTQKLKFGNGKNRKQCGRWRKCWLPAFSSFSHNVFKRPFS